MCLLGPDEERRKKLQLPDLINILFKNKNTFCKKIQLQNV